MHTSEVNKQTELLIFAEPLASMPLKEMQMDRSREEWEATQLAKLRLDLSLKDKTSIDLDNTKSSNVKIDALNTPPTSLESAEEVEIKTHSILAHEIQELERSAVKLGQAARIGAKNIRAYAGNVTGAAYTQLVDLVKAARDLHARAKSIADDMLSLGIDDPDMLRIISQATSIIKSHDSMYSADLWVRIIKTIRDGTENGPGLAKIALHMPKQFVVLRVTIQNFTAGSNEPVIRPSPDQVGSWKVKARIVKVTNECRKLELYRDMIRRMYLLRSAQELSGLYISPFFKDLRKLSHQGVVSERAAAAKLHDERLEWEQKNAPQEGTAERLVWEQQFASLRDMDLSSLGPQIDAATAERMRQSRQQQRRTGRRLSFRAVYQQTIELQQIQAIVAHRTLNGSSTQIVDLSSAATLLDTRVKLNRAAEIQRFLKAAPRKLRRTVEWRIAKELEELASRGHVEASGDHAPAAEAST